MKVLFVANGILGDEPGGLSGGDTRFIEVAKVWAQAGHEIHLLSSKGGQKLCKRLGLDVKLHCFSEARGTGRFTFLLHALKSFFFMPSSLKDFEGIVYSTNEMVFDVLPALRLKLRRGSRVKWAVVVHWMPPFPPWKRKESTIINSILFFLNERLSVWLANHFAGVLLPVSTMTRGQLEVWGANMEKVYAVECGVNFSDIRSIVSSIESYKYDAVYMKRLQAVKGIFDIIDIWQEVMVVRKNATILIIGEGIDGARAKEIVKERGLGQNILFAGVIYDPVEKFTKLAESKLFVLPTHEENWAIVIGEAMAAGVPVITYALKELLDVWGDNLAAVPVGNKQAFAEKILHLLEDPVEWKALKEDGLAAASHYDWDAIGKRELEIVLGAGGGT